METAKRLGRNIFLRANRAAVLQLRSCESRRDGAQLTRRGRPTSLRRASRYSTPSAQLEPVSSMNEPPAALARLEVSEDRALGRKRRRT
jgi:hypothetical protein